MFNWISYDVKYYIYFNRIKTNAFLTIQGRGVVFGNILDFLETFEDWKDELVETQRLP